MASRVVVSGKHPLTVRIDEETYKKMGLIAVEEGMSVNEWIAYVAIRECEKRYTQVVSKE